MTETQKQIAKLLVGLAEYCQATMSREQLEMYTREFDSPEYLGACIVALKKDPDLRTGVMPMPAKIKAALAVSVEEKCYKLVQSIFTAAHRHGYYKPKDAERFVGPVAWQVIQAYGGWGQVCQIETRSMGTAFAQLRDLAISMQKIERIGALRERTGIGQDQKASIGGPERDDADGELVPKELAALTERIGAIE